MHVNVSVKSKLQHPPSPGHTPGIWHFCRPGEEGIWLSESSRAWGIWSPCVRGGEFELHPQFHVKSLAWRAVMGDAVLEDFREKDCAFVANWLRGLCRIWSYLNSNIFNIGFRLWINECIKLCFFITNYNAYTGDSSERWCMSVNFSWWSNLNRWDFF